MSEAAKVCSESQLIGLDREISMVFADCFADEYHTSLVGGAAEPLYQPGQKGGERHQVYYRYDYPRSALHEAAHWCIAGAARRQQLDYGYWYQPDGRDAGTQQRFERVEARPQAIEWHFCLAVGLAFQVSIDNLSGDVIDPFPFRLAVWQQARVCLETGLPPRAERFCAGLSRHFGRRRAGAQSLDLRCLQA